MGIKTLEKRKRKIVKVVSSEATIKHEASTGYVDIERIEKLVGGVYTVKTAADSLEKCIINGQIMLYEDLEHVLENKIKGGRFNPENLVR
jgi:hypothetical protein